MNLAKLIRIDGEDGFAGLSLLCRFVNTQGGRNAAIISEMLFSTGN
jgi:hypothetical protein